MRGDQWACPSRPSTDTAIPSGAPQARTAEITCRARHRGHRLEGETPPTPSTINPFQPSMWAARLGSRVVRAPDRDGQATTTGVPQKVPHPTTRDADHRCETSLRTASLNSTTPTSTAIRGRSAPTAGSLSSRRSDTTKRSRAVATRARASPTQVRKCAPDLRRTAGPPQRDVGNVREDCTSYAKCDPPGDTGRILSGRRVAGSRRRSSRQRIEIVIIRRPQEHARAPVHSQPRSLLMYHTLTRSVIWTLEELKDQNAPYDSGPRDTNGVRPPPTAATPRSISKRHRLDYTPKYGLSLGLTTMRRSLRGRG